MLAGYIPIKLKCWDGSNVAELEPPPETLVFIEATPKELSLALKNSTSKESILILVWDVKLPKFCNNPTVPASFNLALTSNGISVKNLESLSLGNIFNSS